jgi:hypothetical protein
VKTRPSVLAALTTIVVAVALLVPAYASAASPVLEFVAPGHSLPVRFTTESGSVRAVMAGFRYTVHCSASHGEGEITGPRTAVASYAFTGCVAEVGGRIETTCKTEGAGAEEITTGRINAELVYIDQARHQVGILLNPGGGTFISFRCSGEAAEGQGPFLSTVSPINTVTTSFATPLSETATVMTPNEYENARGETQLAIPLGTHGSGNPLVPIGVDAGIIVTPSVPVEVKAISAAEVEASQREEAAQKKSQEDAKQQEEVLNTLHQEEAANKRLQGEVSAQAAAIKSLQEEAAKKKLEEARKARSRRAQLLAKALKQCQRQPKRKRAACRAKAHKRYGVKKQTTAIATDAGVGGSSGLTPRAIAIIGAWCAYV